MKRKKEELKGYSEYLKSARELFARYKGEMTGNHKKEVFEAISDVAQQLDRAWKEWKDAWERVHHARHESHQNKTLQFIGKQEDFLKKLYESLGRKEDHLRDLHYKIDSVRSDDFRGRVYDWIREEERKIDEVKAKIKDVEESKIR